MKLADWTNLTAWADITVFTDHLSDPPGPCRSTQAFRYRLRHAGAEAFESPDVLTIHTVLSRRMRGLVDAEMLALMKPTAYLINMSRGPIVDEGALLAALNEGRIAGAGVDVFDMEPLPADHPFRKMRNVLATPHLGYVTRHMYETFYRDSVGNIESWHARNAG